MPHSVNSESKTPPTEMDGTMTDATLQDGDVAMGEADSLPSSTANNGAPAAQGDGSADADTKNEVKLEELFADVDSDDEFPSSRPNNKPSSPPPAPSSPV